MGKDEKSYGNPEEEEDSNLVMPTKVPMKATCPMKIELGKYEIDTIYRSPYPGGLSEASILYICEFCLEYTDNPIDMKKHMIGCNCKQPYGREIYNKDEISVFEVDGDIEELYCENLYLHGKLFLDDKAECDVENFLFYVLTVNDSKGKHIAGYFSKEKYPETNQNVSCLLILPQYQRQGFGHFLIEFGYLLSRLEKKPGTPEKPLSQFGLLTYHNYWKNVVGEYLYNHIDKKSITVKSISDETGIDPYDIGDTLQMLNLVKQRNGKVSIVIKQRILTEQMELLKAKEHVRVDEECLNWTPSFTGISPKKKGDGTPKDIDRKRRHTSHSDSETVGIIPPPSKLQKRENIETEHFNNMDDASS